MHPPTLLLVSFACLALACRGGEPPESSVVPRADWRYVPDLAVSHPPFTDLVANYKERLDQPYVFLELRGPYSGTGRRLPELGARLASKGLAASGPPFALFYDDPGRVPSAELRSRACLPVELPPAASLGLEHDVLPAATVVYAVVSGPYPDVPRAYPGLIAYAGRMSWVENGPLREIYLTSPADVASYDELLCEIQLPVTQRP